MKKILLLLLPILLIVGCDNWDNYNAGVDVTVDGYPDDIGNYWIYSCSNSISDSSYIMDGISFLRIIDYNINNHECGQNVMIIEKTDSITVFEGLTLLAIDDTTAIDSIQAAPPFSIGSVVKDTIIYDISNNKLERCLSLYELNQLEQSDSIDTDSNGMPDQPDVVTKVATSFFSIVSLPNIQYPLYVGKVWEGDNILSISYEVTSRENVTIQKNGYYDTYDCFVITMLIADMEINYYVSSQGLVKVEFYYDFFDTSTGEVEYSTSVSECILIDH